MERWLPSLDPLSGIKTDVDGSSVVVPDFC